MPELVRFDVDGSPCSANLVTRRVGNRSVKSADARRYQERVRDIASRAFDGEPTSAPCAVVIEAINVRIDVDNIAKTILDGMAGVVFRNDRQVQHLTVARLRDRSAKAPRIAVFASTITDPA